MVRYLVIFCLVFSCYSFSAEKLKIFTWEGYVTADDIEEVNKQLSDKGYDFQAEVIPIFAQDEAQMFSVIRDKQCDISFLTLFFLKMHGEQTLKLLQPVNVKSPRLSNYQHLDKNLLNIPMGVKNSQQYYIPWGGGIYGFYINGNKVQTHEIPQSLNDLWHSRWSKKLSLTKGQFWYNIAISLQALGLHPFKIQQLTEQGNRAALKELMVEGGALEQKIRHLYLQSNELWLDSPRFPPELDIVTSWGPEIVQQNNKGANWQLIDFPEGHLAWLDTINFVKHLSGRKLEAAEVVANYFISKPVQKRIASELSMIPAANIANRGLLDLYPQLFESGLFVPPFNQFSYNLMQQMVDRAVVNKLTD